MKKKKIYLSPKDVVKIKLYVKETSYFGCPQ